AVQVAGVASRSLNPSRTAYETPWRLSLAAVSSRPLFASQRPITLLTRLLFTTSFFRRAEVSASCVRLGEAILALPIIHLACACDDVIRLPSFNIAKPIADAATKFDIWDAPTIEPVGLNGANRSLLAFGELAFSKQNRVLTHTSLLFPLADIP